MLAEGSGTALLLQTLQMNGNCRTSENQEYTHIKMGRAGWTHPYHEPYPAQHPTIRKGPPEPQLFPED